MLSLSTLSVDFIRGLYHTLAMTGPQAISIIKSLGLSSREFAHMVGLHQNAVYKWAKGTEPQGPARALLWLLDERPELVQVLRRKRT